MVMIFSSLDGTKRKFYFAIVNPTGALSLPESYMLI